MLQALHSQFSCGYHSCIQRLCALSKRCNLTTRRGPGSESALDGKQSCHCSVYPMETSVVTCCHGDKPTTGSVGCHAPPPSADRCMEPHWIASRTALPPQISILPWGVPVKSRLGNAPQSDEPDVSVCCHEKRVDATIRYLGATAIEMCGI